MNLRCLPLLVVLLTPACTVYTRGGAHFEAPAPKVVVTVDAPVAVMQMRGRSFVHRVDGKFNSVVRFSASRHGTSGTMANDGGQGTWTLEGRTLVMRWPAVGAPGGFWVDTVVLSPDGSSYEGTNNVGSFISGSRKPHVGFGFTAAD